MSEKFDNVPTDEDTRTLLSVVAKFDVRVTSGKGVVHLEYLDDDGIVCSSCRATAIAAK